MNPKVFLSGILAAFSRRMVASASFGVMTSWSSSTEAPCTLGPLRAKPTTPYSPSLQLQCKKPQGGETSKSHKYSSCSFGVLPWIHKQFDLVERQGLTTDWGARRHFLQSLQRWELCSYPGDRGPVWESDVHQADKGYIQTTKPRAGRGYQPVLEGGKQQQKK